MIRQLAAGLVLVCVLAACDAAPVPTPTAAPQVAALPTRPPSTAPLRPPTRVPAPTAKPVVDVVNASPAQAPAAASGNSAIVTGGAAGANAPGSVANPVPNGGAGAQPVGPPTSAGNSAGVPSAAVAGSNPAGAVGGAEQPGQGEAPSIGADGPAPIAGAGIAALGLPAPPGVMPRAQPSPTQRRAPTPPAGSTPPPVSASARPLSARPADGIDRSRYTPPLVRNGNRKWGVGVYRDSNRVAEVLRSTQPGVILLMDPSVGWAERVRKEHPYAFIVGRRFRPDSEQRLDKPEVYGAAYADWVAELAVPLKGVVDAWMSYNEPLGSTGSPAYDAYNRFQIAFARRLQYTHGIAAVSGNNGPGALQPEDYPRFFAGAIQESEFFGLHLYAPTGATTMQREAEWHALRYRKVHEALERAGIRGKRMVVTESGMADGFRVPGMAAETMADGYVWLTREMQRDQYMIGHAAFGIFDARAGDWAGHDLTESGVLEQVPTLLGRLIP